MDKICLNYIRSQEHAEIPGCYKLIFVPGGHFDDFMTFWGGAKMIVTSTSITYRITYKPSSKTIKNQLGNGFIILEDISLSKIVTN